MLFLFYCAERRQNGIMICTFLLTMCTVLMYTQTHICIWMYLFVWTTQFWFKTRSYKFWTFISMPRILFALYLTQFPDGCNKNDGKDNIFSHFWCNLCMKSKQKFVVQNEKYSRFFFSRETEKSKMLAEN